MQQASSVAVAEAIRPIAVRQSRKASLAQFLEKRKDRVSSVMPYQLSKSQQERAVAAWAVRALQAGYLAQTMPH
ncbi:hypothetical protein ZWY2020_051936 [Hordeum vulgare]|nr:hypothetical protein ZWY2020_051936 [Hordeum vulgare]